MLGENTKRATKGALFVERAEGCAASVGCETATPTEVENPTTCSAPQCSGTDAYAAEHAGSRSDEPAVSSTVQRPAKAEPGAPDTAKAHGLPIEIGVGTQNTTEMLTMDKLAPAFALSTLLALGCGSVERPPAAPPYAPRYSYSAKGDETKHDITIAIINPAVKGKVRGTDGEKMLSALPTAFVDLVTAKGMKYRGPVENHEPRCSNAEMTFPDKKGSDLGLCAEIDVDTGWRPMNVKTDGEPGAWGPPTMRTTCDIEVSFDGRVSFIVIEPLSGETLWRKTLPLNAKPRIIQGQRGLVCGSGPAGSSDDPSPDGEVGDTYRRGLERLFWGVMKGIDTFMSVEEFDMLRKQSQELREKKVY